MAKQPKGLKASQSSQAFNSYRSGSWADLLTIKMGMRERSNSTPDIRETKAEQKRLYEELPFQALPGMRTKSIVRVRSIASMKKNESFMGRIRGESVSAANNIQVQNAPSHYGPSCSNPMI
jgi:hypothetical protein